VGGGHSDGRVAGDRGEAGAAAAAAFAVGEVHGRRGPAGKHDQGVELLRVHRGVDALGARKADACRPGFEVGGIGQRAAGLGGR